MNITELIEKRFGRRAFLSATGALSCTSHKLAVPFTKWPDAPKQIPAFAFTNLEPTISENHQVAVEYEAKLLIAWGDPIFESDKNVDLRTLTAEEQKRIFGYNNDFIAFFQQSSDRGVLVVNHESSTASLMFADQDSYVSSDPKHWGIERMAHGMTVVALTRKGSDWEIDRTAAQNRRITMNTEMVFTGPVAGHKRLKTPQHKNGLTVRGMVHNCSGGKTPWGTVLTCEENILYYFGGSCTESKELPDLKRYHIPHSKGYRLFTQDSDLDLSQAPTAANRYGWVVEIDPMDPGSIPKKRTALGRLFHESANPILNEDGRIVIYMGDDGYFEYLYRFVSARAYNDSADDWNSGLLDDGEMSVAVFHEDGSLDWLPLRYGERGLTAENGFEDQADVLIGARRAGDILGATSMDRTEDVEPNPHTNMVYVNCTKNPRRGQEGMPAENPANPIANNQGGHIIELRPPGGDHTADRMTWSVLLIAGDDPSSDYGAAPRFDARFACPDNACVDPSGRLWVSTDGAEETIGVPDGLYGVETSGPHRGEARRLFSAPPGAEVTGPCFSDDGRALFLAVQHPGDLWNGDPTVSNWPDFVPGYPPRPGIVLLRRKDGGVIGDG